MSDKDDFWQQRLSAEQYEILRRAQTEPSHTGRLLHHKQPGTYLCGACEEPLFQSEHKFDSGSGWPSFYQTINRQAIESRSDDALGLLRTEILCGQCQSHLGHVFDDAPQTPTGQRYCINSLALKFKGQDDQIIAG